MLRLTALILCLLIPALAMANDRPRAGLMWNNSGLPATFPLQVKTMPGKDYVVYITEPDSGDPVMAGYIRGGDFFRLLVPPGKWRLRFAHGWGWQGEVGLFGTATGWTEMEEILDFHVVGRDRRRAYIVTLTEENGRMTIVSADPRMECQMLLWKDTVRDWPEEPPLWRLPRFTVYNRLCA